MFQQMHVGYDNDTLEDEEEAIMSSAIPSEVDPLDFVYTNIPDTTHILKLDANCKHCKAKKLCLRLTASAVAMARSNLNNLSQSQS